MSTFPRSSDRGPQDVIRGEVHESQDDTSSRYVRSEPMGPSRPGPGGNPFGAFGGGRPLRLPRTSLPTAGLLALVLGPLGMFYSTIFGAFVMAGVVFWTVVFAGLEGLPVPWIIGIAWAVWAAHRRNRRIALLEAQFGTL